MANTALNRTVVALLTNKSGGALAYGDVVILDNTNAKGFTTTTTAGLSTRGLGVILEPNGIANNATGLVATAGWIPKVNLNTAATIGQLLRTHTVAGQAAPHDAPQLDGDFGVALQASATPEALLFSSPNRAGGYGAMVTKAADQTGANYTTITAIAWDSEVYDDLGFHDNVTNNTRLTIPASPPISRVNLSAGIEITNITSGDRVSLVFRKNGSTSFNGSVGVRAEDAATSRAVSLAVVGVPVVAGDYFEVFLQNTGADTAIDLTAARCHFEIQVVQN